jgi:hypothetical protein
MKRLQLSSSGRSKATFKQAKTEKQFNFNQQMNYRTKCLKFTENKENISTETVILTTYLPVMQIGLNL